MSTDKTVYCYYGIMSPFSYLGMPTLKEICRNHWAELVYKPTDFFEVFKVSGGVPLHKRPLQRRKYRLVELKRWAEYRQMPLNVEPKYFPVDMTPASLMVLAAIKRGHYPGDLSFAYERATWVEERDISDKNTIIAIANEHNFDGEELFALSQTDEISAVYAANTREAIDLDMFGSPSYYYRNELFWGQDRLDFLERALAAN
ncbi:MAG: 2-hydroxychromene-2-carboxylate isomerase [Alphaproteobacteria bacterium]|nr:2-hydroxychromene-2-carboxylate isomerase [Alphaproteobacteria bacterium]